MSATRRVVTSADVREASATSERSIVLSSHDLVTPLARDDAAELGVRLVVHGDEDPTPPPPAPDANGHDLEQVVRRVVTSMIGTPRNGAGGVSHVDSRDVQTEPFPFPGPTPAMDCRIADVITAEEHGASMGAGFLSLHAGSFPWTLDYDEVEYVVEGELHIGTDAGTIVGRPGDVLYVKKGSSITFGTPSWARFFYVTYPADWAGGR